MDQNASVLIWETVKSLQKGGSLEQAMSETLRRLTAAMGCEECALWLLNVKDSRLYVVACVGKQDLTGAFLDLDRGIPGAVTRSGKTELIADCASDPRFAQIKGGNIPRNLLVIPLKNQYECIGCLQLTERKESDFTQEDVYYCTLVASLLAIALGERGVTLRTPESRKALIALRDLTCRKSEDDSALRHLNLNIYEHETLAVLGESGCGSRTLLRLLHLAEGGEEVREGRFLAAGRDMLSAAEGELDDYRRGFVSYIYPDCPLVPTMTVKANIALTAKNALEPLSPEEALFLVGLKDCGRLLPEKLDPRQRQLVGVARALARKPDLILAEEPGGNLAAAAAKEVLGVLLSAAKQLGAAVVLTTHNPEIARTADRVLYLKGGQISEVRVNPEPAAASELEW